MNNKQMTPEEAMKLTERRAAAMRYMKANARQFSEQMAMKIEAATKVEHTDPHAPFISISRVKTEGER